MWLSPPHPRPNERDELCGGALRDLGASATSPRRRVLALGSRAEAATARAEGGQRITTPIDPVVHAGELSKPQRNRGSISAYPLVGTKLIMQPGWLYPAQAHSRRMGQAQIHN